MITADTEMIVIDLDDPENNKGRLKQVGGSRSDHWNSALINQTCNALGLAHSDKGTCEQRCGATVAALMGIGPKDEIEGMIAAQMLASDRKSTRLNSSHLGISYAVFCLKKKK